MVEQISSGALTPKYKFNLSSTTSATIIGSEVLIYADLSSQDGKPVADAKIDLYDKETGIIVASGKTNTMGHIFLRVKVDKPKLEVTGKASVPE